MNHNASYASVLRWNEDLTRQMGQRKQTGSAWVTKWRGGGLHGLLKPLAASPENPSHVCADLSGICIRSQLFVSVPLLTFLGQVFISLGSITRFRSPSAAHSCDYQNPPHQLSDTEEVVCRTSAKIKCYYPEGSSSLLLSVLVFSHFYAYLKLSI